MVCPGSGYQPRTLANVRDSDGTLILLTRVLSTGTKLTRDLCVREKKPFLALDAAPVTVERAVSAALQFIAEHSIAVMNVAGPRVSGWPEGYRCALEVVGVSFRGPPLGIGDRSIPLAWATHSVVPLSDPVPFNGLRDAIYGKT